MSDFVEQCRQEWRRLGVPDPLAEEMAADLATDLGEAEAEGVSAQELLGSSAFDPKAFAGSWAAARGIIPAAVTPGRKRRRPLALVAFTGLAATMLVVAALLLLAGKPTVSLTTSAAPRPHIRLLPATPVVPPGPGHQVLSTNAAAPVEWILLVLAIAALGFAVWLWSRWGRSRHPIAPAQ